MVNNYLSYRLSKPIARDLKKIKKTNKSLYKKIDDTITLIRKEPYTGNRKTGDLKGIFSVDIYHAGINYELAYTFIKEENGEVILFILFGTKENFYKSLKRNLK